MSKKQDKLNAMTYDTEYLVGAATSFRDRHYVRLIETLTARVADASFKGDNYTLTQEDCSELKEVIRTYNGQDTLDIIEKSVQHDDLPKMIQLYMALHVSDEEMEDVEADFWRYRDENKFDKGYSINSSWITQRENLLREQDKQEKLAEELNKYAETLANAPFGCGMMTYELQEKFNGVVYHTDFDELSDYFDGSFHPEMTHKSNEKGLHDSIKKGESIAIITDAGDGFSICIDAAGNLDWMNNTHLKQL